MTHPDLLQNRIEFSGADLDPFVSPSCLCIRLWSPAGILRGGPPATSIAGYVASVALFPMLWDLWRGIFQEVFESRSAKRMAAQIGRIPGERTSPFSTASRLASRFTWEKPGRSSPATVGELTSNYVIYALKRQATWLPQAIPLSEFDTWIAAQKRPVFLVFRSNSRAVVDRLCRGQARPSSPFPGFLGISFPRRGS